MASPAVLLSLLAQSNTILANIKTLIKKTFEILNLSFFDDDLFSGENNVLEAFNLSKEAVDILKEGVMKLRKFEELKKRWIDEKIPFSDSDSANTSLKVQ